MMKGFLYRLVRSPMFVALGVMLLALPLAFAQSGSSSGSSGGSSASSGGSSSGKTETYTIKESDYQYNPAQMTWHVGDTVKLTIENTSKKDNHEFIMGKKPLNYVKSSFGNKWPFGWQNTLFSKKSQVTFSNGQGVMAKNMSKGGTLQPGSVELKKGGSSHVTLTFKVPDKTGTWKYACFEEKGQHYTSHNMVGTITIKK